MLFYELKHCRKVLNFCRPEADGKYPFVDGRSLLPSAKAYRQGRLTKDRGLFGNFCWLLGRWKIRVNFRRLSVADRSYGGITSVGYGRPTKVKYQLTSIGLP
jgi:hypothetical protein